MRRLIRVSDSFDCAKSQLQHTFFYLKSFNLDSLTAISDIPSVRAVAFDVPSFL